MIRLALFLLVVQCTSLNAQADEPAKLEKNGPTKTVERVEPMALKWLNDHQLADGGWSFTEGGAKPYANPGESRDRVDATSLALFCFLAHGIDHQRDSPYQQTVSNGLHFLIAQAKLANDRADLRGAVGNLVTQSRAACALCDAYGLTQDRKLAAMAQSAVRFLEHAQNEKTGGWGLQPAEPADVAVTVWAITCLRSAGLAGLEVSAKTNQNLKRFLESIQSEQGAYYGRQAPGKDAYATACGWRSLYLLEGRDTIPAFGKDRRPAFDKGVKFIEHEGFNPKDCTFNFLAYHVLYANTSGDDLIRANRRQLVETIVREGPDRGSWFSPADVNAKSGGRLYQTAISTLTLGVWCGYRHRLYDPR